MKLTKSLWRIALAVPVMALAGTAAGTITAQVASATVVGCGTTITVNTTLTADVGPCASGDGIILGADGITLNLNGHKVSGAAACCLPPVPPATVGTRPLPFSAANAGVHILGVNGTTVKSGSVTGFSAGVLIDGGPTCFGPVTCTLGANNTVTHMNVFGNIGSENANYGDGIALDNGASYNQVTYNFATNNGPYDGIGLVASASFNTIASNTVSFNTVPNFNATTGANDGNTDFGIRVEGPSATNNTLIGNNVSGSGSSGIGVLPVCPDAFTTHLCQFVSGNSPTLISRNVTNGNGFDGINLFGMGLVNAFQPNHVTIINHTANNNGHDGIDLQGVNCIGAGNGFCAPLNVAVTSSTANNNIRNGITVGQGTTNSTISNNKASRNVNNGISASLGANNNTLQANRGSLNGVWDGFDGNLALVGPPPSPACGTDVWHANVFNTVNQPCVAAP